MLTQERSQGLGLSGCSSLRISRLKKKINDDYKIELMCSLQTTLSCNFLISLRKI